jgi:hypothetical protein
MAPAYDVTSRVAHVANESWAGAAAHLITRDEARRIAANIAKLPEMRGPDSTPARGIPWQVADPVEPPQLRR